MASSYQILKRCFSSTSVQNYIIKNVTVIGGGLMGSGIAQISAQSGHNVTLVDISESVLKKSQASIEKNLQRVAKKQFKDKTENADRFVNDSLARLKFETAVEKGVSEADLVVEAIVENLSVKHKLFGSIDKIAPEKTIFASNTSSLSVTDIASITSRKDRFGGLHFFNPVPVMKLLEVVRTAQTSDETYNAMMDWGKNVGKVCITAKDTPGFVVNRLLVPYLGEAIRMLERGDASSKDIDTAMKLGAGYPMGPFELADYVGHDTTLFILQGWYEKYKNPLFEPPKMLEDMVKQGKLGNKTGEGFYKHDKK